MILVNGKTINLTHFPDGTTSFRFDPSKFDYFEITWKYDSDQECILLWYLVKHIRSICGESQEILLFMPYIPNARMDRVINNDEIFTLKWFAEFINSMSFTKVYVLDPHSNVSSALIDRIGTWDVGFYVYFAVHKILNDYNVTNLLFCYPDEGAMKRYSQLFTEEYVYGIKHRDWRTGEIKGLEIAKKEKVAGRDVLIIDDICSKGGTFTHMASALKEAGAKEIFLYVSHCENTIHQGSILDDDLIRHVYTTDSIFRKEHNMIECITVSPYI